MFGVDVEAQHSVRVCQSGLGAVRCIVRLCMG